MLKKISFLLVFAVVFSFAGCKAKSGAEIIKYFDITINGKPANVDFCDGTSLYYDGGKTTEITDKDENSNTVKGVLSVKGIKMGDTLESVIKTLGITSGFAEFDYEYDPYGDGCTEIGTAVYDGELVDLEKLHVLDINLQAAYHQTDGGWQLIDRNRNKLKDFKEVFLLSVDFNGVCELYADKPGVAVSITAALCRF